MGLNPLLQHPAMVIHPPCLYLGMIGFTVPFAFAVGALISGRLDNDWLKKARLWAVVAWLFLGAGNILGGWWAYLELGWGGYWAWDPVENASFMPWLAGTAYIHSAMIQERK
ncbi:MAG: cytochrome c biogenesis protein CcsA [Candidatus Eisenbacteria bacterium]